MLQKKKKCIGILGSFRFPGPWTKWPFPMKRRPSPLPNSSPRPKAWALLWPSEAPEKNAPVVVLVNHRAANLAACFGALYAGNFYVPLDSQMPLPLACVPFWKPSPPPPWYMTRRRRRPPKPWRSTAPLLLDREGFACPEDLSLLTARRRGVLDIDPVYAIFTSGSTGTPKGIVISHRSVIDFIEWMAEACQITGEDVMGNQAPFYFDLSVKDIYLTLKCGATTHIIPKKDFLFPTLLIDFLEEKKVTALIWATSAFHLVANSGVLEKKAPSCLRTAILGGEALQAKQLNRWRAALPQVQYINLYGPTEVTVDCTWYPIQRNFADHERIPIGTACANKEVFLLDETLRPVPQASLGRSACAAWAWPRGYFGQWDKTRAAFIQDPRNPNYPRPDLPHWRLGGDG